MTNRPIADSILALTERLEVNEPRPPKPMHKTHLFIMHPARFYDFAVEMNDIMATVTGTWKRAPPLPETDRETICGLEVAGWFREIPVTVSPNCPLLELHFMTIADLKSNVARGLTP